MGRWFVIPGLVVPCLAVTPMLVGQDPSPGAAAEIEVPSTASEARPAVQEPRSVLKTVLGLKVASVPAELCAQLGLETELGVLVQEVADGSPASRGGLEQYDVLVTVNGEPATERSLASSVEQDPELSLDLVRQGTLEHVVIALSQETEGEPEDRGRFFSAEDLSGEHPFRRLEAFAALRESYSSEAAGITSRLRDLEQKEREAMNEAREEKQALHALCVGQANEYFQEVVEELVARVDGELSAERLNRVRELQLSFAELVAPEALESMTAELEATRTLLGHGLIEAAMQPVASLPAQNQQYAQQRFTALGQEWSQVFAGRVEQPWKESFQAIAHHQPRLDTQYAQHASKAEATLESIRQELHKRITCAAKRSVESFSKDLKGRLERIELPRPGEVEAALEDVRDQMAAMTDRFLTRLDSALARFEEEVAASNERLTSSAAGHVPGCVTALDETLATLQEQVTQYSAPEESELAEDWRSKDGIRRRYDAYRAALHDAVNVARNATRAHHRALKESFHEHRVVEEDAWRDLEQILHEIRAQAANDCWKLEGPHLDGRFPKEGAPTKKVARR